jgi:hypothetical protein
MKIQMSILALSCLYLTACDPFWNENFEDRNTSEYDAILIKKADLPKTISLKDPQPILEAGKIYAYGNYIFITEMYKGLHIINNTDPSNPINERFVAIGGVVDMVFKDNQLIADNSVDLISIDLSNPEQLIVSSRLSNVFNQPLPPDLSILPERYNNLDNDMVILRWEKKK